ncbi:MAG: SH3 domain-containing protein [Clostridia bacterium]|nr:SH3 domain-containing protein [Clostridia bacterium]
MRKLLVLLLALLLTAALCTAEESQPVEAARFTVELPAGMTPDLDEYSLKDYPFLHHILRPVIIQGENSNCMLLISLYDFPSDARHRIDARVNRDHGLFDLMCEYYGLSFPGRTVRADGDYRDFVLGGSPEEGRYLLTFYNDDHGDGYIFELWVKDGALTAAEAEATLLQTASSLREAGVIYPRFTGSTLVIIHAGVNVRSAPDPKSAVLCVVKQGDTFPFLGESGIWYMIDVNGKVGYVSMALTEILE